MRDMIGQRHTFASYFAFAVDAILKVLWREGFARGPQELVRLTWYRIRRLERRFNALVAQWRAGTLPAVGVVRSLEPTPHPDPPPQGGREKKPRAAWVFPRGRGWVVRLLAPVTGPHCVGTLCLAWEEAEMAALHAAAPQVGRILRPLAHMIGARVPEWLQLPKRVRVRRKDASRRTVVRGEQRWAEAHPTAHPTTRRDARSELIIPNRRLPAKEQADDALRRSEASGKPIDVPPGDGE